MLQNLLLARHAPQEVGFFAELLFLPSVRRTELEHREAVEKVIDFLDLQHYRDSLIVNLPYGVRKVAELARALAPSPSCCCSTSRPPASTSRRPRTWRSGSRTSGTCSASPC